jgi:uroporphyrinogen decarboxylase
MSTWTSRDRFSATLAGQAPDRPPISAWRHFIDHEHGAATLAQATIDFARQWGWDWVKINPRATYYAEAWGKIYDISDYRDVLPRQVSTPIIRPADLYTIGRLDAATTPALREHLEAARLVRAGLPELPVTQTVFSPLGVLLDLAGRPAFARGAVYGSTDPIPLLELLSADRSGLHRALRAIAETLADYVSHLLSPSVGLDGIFYAVLGTAQTGLLDAATFHELSRPYDEIVLAAADGAVRILHTCGPQSHPEWFINYPVDGINWDQQATGNPGLIAPLSRIAVGGVSHELIATGTPDQVEAQTRAALRIADGRPFLLTPGCAIPIAVPDANLAAFRSVLQEN